MAPRFAVVLAVCLASGPLVCQGQAVPPGPTLQIPTLDRGDVPDQRKRRRRVAILPFRSNLVRQSALFSPAGTVAPPQDLSALERQVAAVLSADPYLDVITPAAVRAALVSDHGLATAARQADQWYRIGLAHWMSMAPRRAAETFTKAVDLYAEVFQDVTAPKALADASFMKGAALVDAGETIQGHVALKAAFAQQPDRRFRPRFFAPAIERALQAALADYMATGNLQRPYGDAARLVGLARSLRLDAIITAAVVPGVDGAEGRLAVAVLGVRRRAFEAETRLPLSELKDGLDPFLSRWRACLPVLDAKPTSSRRPHFANVWMDTSGTYAQYLRHEPTRQAFHSLGFAAGVSQQLSPGLEWFTRVNLYTSLSDPYQDLAHPFNSLRLVGGVGFAFKRGPFRLFARPGLDAHVLGSFIATHDRWCKKLQDHPLCKGPIYNLEQDILFGVNLALGAQIHVGTRFFVAVNSSMSSYFLPFTGTDQLNYLLSGDLGMGYRF